MRWMGTGLADAACSAPTSLRSRPRRRRAGASTSPPAPLPKVRAGARPARSSPRRQPGPGDHGRDAARAASHRRAALTLPARCRSGALHLRSVAFDRRVGRLLERGGLAVISWSNAGVETIRAASQLGVRSFLDYPVAHHAWARRLSPRRPGSTPSCRRSRLAELPSSMRPRMKTEMRRPTASWS